MTKENFLFLWIHNYFMTSIKITIAIESYFNSTIVDFYKNITHELNRALEQYDRVTTKAQEIGLPELQSNAILENYILNLKEKEIMHFIDIVQKNIDSKNSLCEYDVNKEYKSFIEKRSSNVFLDIIKDIRRKEMIIV